MAAALIQLARTLGYGTIAEGVETAAQEESLRRLGCAHAQGYHLGRPLDAEAARWLLAAHDLHEAAGARSAPDSRRPARPPRDQSVASAIDGRSPAGPSSHSRRAHVARTSSSL